MNRALLLAALAAAAGFPTVAAPAQEYTERLSKNSLGTEGDGPSDSPIISLDARFLVFASEATNLVPNDTNGLRDVFVHERTPGLTSRASESSSGAQANGASFDPAITANGEYVAFASAATNLVPGDTNGRTDVFVRHVASGIVERISVDSLGGQADGDSDRPSLSADGRYVAFRSDADDLVPGDTNGRSDVFVHDRLTGLTRRVSVGPGGAQAHGDSVQPALSADGRFVAFASDADDLVPGDTNGASDVFLHDWMTGITERVSVDSAGAQAGGPSHDPAVSADGDLVVFASAADDLVPGDTNAADDVFLRDRRAGSTERVSLDSAGAQASGSSASPALTTDGSFVTFDSDAPNLVPGDTNGVRDVFQRERSVGRTVRVSVQSGGQQANGPSRAPSSLVDGRVTVFQSDASNLVVGDGNGASDVFLRNRGPSATGTESIVVLAADVLLSPGRAVRFAWYCSAPGTPWWLLGSFGRGGSVLGGHPFQVGPMVRILAHGTMDPAGAGTWLSPPLPGAFLGRTLYVEVGAISGGGEIRDSNLVERIVQ